LAGLHVVFGGKQAYAGLACGVQYIECTRAFIESAQMDTLGAAFLANQGTGER
jgi:hypothetical protein